MLTIIDLSSIFWQTWHATGDQEVGAAHTATMQKIAKHTGGGGEVLVATDSPPYDRARLYPEYKANRERHTQVAVEQLERVKSALAGMGYKVYFSPGNEADDVIATLVRSAGTPCDINIVTGDKDLAQLCANRGVTVTSTQTGLVADADGVLNKFGVFPEQIPDLLALMGDKSDNIPGAPGVGIKIGGDLLRKFKSVKNLLDVAASGDPDNEIGPPKVRESIIAHIDKINLATRLTTLKSDCQLELFKPAQEPTVIDIEFEAEPLDARSTDAIDVTGSPVASNSVFVSSPETDTAQESAPASSSIVARPVEWIRQLEPSTSGNAWKLAQILYNSRLYTKFANPEAITAVILRGRALGLDATTALDEFHVIEGKPSMGAHLIVGLVLNSGKARYLYEVEGSSESSTWATWRHGNPTEQRYTFTIDMARARGLLVPSKSGKPTQWQKMPDVMLSWRAATALARKVYPDVIGGLYTPDEIEVG